MGAQVFSSPAACAPTSDAELFAPYQPAYGAPYDTANCFDRVNLRGHIERGLRKCDNYLALVTRQRRRGLVSALYYHEAVHKVLDTWARHAAALSRLEQIESQNLGSMR